MSSKVSSKEAMFALLLDAMKTVRYDGAIPVENISMDDNLSSIGLDSVRAIEIAAVVEEKLGVRFPDDQLARAKSVRDLVELLVRYGRHAA